MKQQIPISGMSCGHCIQEVKQALQTIPSIQYISVSLATHQATIESENPIAFQTIQTAFDTHAPRFRVGQQTSTSTEPQLDATSATDNTTYYCPMYCEGKKTYEKPIPCPVCGMDLVAKSTESTGTSAHDQGIRTWRNRVWVGGLFTFALLIIAMGPMLFSSLHIDPVWNVSLQFLLSIPVVLYTGAPFFQRGLQSLRSGKFNMFTLIAMGAGVAWIYSLYVSWYAADYAHSEHLPLYYEAAAMILALAALGQYWEAKAYKKTQGDLQALLDLAPEHTTVIVDGQSLRIPREQLRKGDILQLAAGERIPADGLVVEGNSSIDTAALTGESLPKSVGKGDAVFAGTVNLDGALQVQVDRIGAQSKMGQIVQLVQEAVSEKTPIQLLVDRVSRWFVPIVFSIAVVTFLYWWLVQSNLELALTHSIAVLIIACPCALGLATPMSLLVGLGSAARQGLLVQRASALENLAEVDCLVLDKTGTLTEGKPVVADFLLAESAPIRIENALAALHQHSQHPLSTAIQAKFDSQNESLSQFKNLPGLGLTAIWNGQPLAMGNAVLCEYTGVEIPANMLQFASDWQEKGATVSYLIYDQLCTGVVAFQDTLKANTLATLSELKAKNIELALLSGDDQRAVSYWAKTLQLDSALGNQLPDDKLTWIKNQQRLGKKVAMVGDGINDAPALAQADVGLSIDHGSDLAIQSADIVLLNGDIGHLRQAFYWSDRIRNNIKQNLFFAFLYNVIGIPLSAGVFYTVAGISLNPMWAAAAMSLSSLSVITNALRLRLR